MGTKTIPGVTDEQLPDVTEKASEWYLKWKAKIAAKGIVFADLPLASFMAGYIAGFGDSGELVQLFELQQRRMSEATLLWRRENPGKENISPDLGDLLQWLMERAEEKGY